MWMFHFIIQECGLRCNCQYQLGCENQRTHWEMICQRGPQGMTRHRGVYKALGGRVGWVDNGVSHHTQGPMFNLLDLYNGRKESTCANSTLTSTWIPWHAHTEKRTHTKTLFNFLIYSSLIHLDTASSPFIPLNTPHTCSLPHILFSPYFSLEKNRPPRYINWTLHKLH